MNDLHQRQLFDDPPATIVRARRWTGSAYRALEARLRKPLRLAVCGGLDLLFPPACVLCQAEPEGAFDDGVQLCQGCRKLLVPTTLPRCLRCGETISGVLQAAPRCTRCRKTPLSFDTVRPLGTYRAELREAVLQMKHSWQESLSTALGNWLAEKLAAELRELDLDLVAPIPMHWRRRLARGVNSPDFVAECIARRLRVPLARRLLVRQRYTPVQVDVSTHERFANLRGAFRVRPYRVHRGDLNGARVLLVDDILTTGATCHAAGKALRAAGAAMIAVAVVARAESH